jgi:uncharacterized protein
MAIALFVLVLAVNPVHAQKMEGARGRHFPQNDRRELSPRMSKINYSQRPMDYYEGGCSHGGAATAAKCFGNVAGNTISFQPGDFSDGKRSEDGLVILSNGLSAKPIAETGKFVNFANGGSSTIQFHGQPDGAGVFEKADGGWYYVSNCENETVGENWWNGGVGSLEFDKDGNVINYFRVANRTRHNCSGGKTPWNSWVTCEELDFGEVYQVDPTGARSPIKTAMGNMGHYESFAFDDNTNPPTFYVTRDSKRGSLSRFTPDDVGMACYNQINDYDRWCTLDHGTIDYLLISGGPSGTFTWTTDETAARDNAELYYPNSEGIDVADGILFTTNKKLKRLMILNLTAMTYTYESTVGGAFNEQPDQVARLVKDDPNSILYFCEDGGKGDNSPGVSGRSPNGEYFDIFRGTFPNKDETSGLAFSPDRSHMYVSYQHVGIIYDLWRDDGLPFSGAMLDIKYHTMDVTASS